MKLLIEYTLARLKFSQKELAQTLGVSEAQISKWKKDEYISHAHQEEIENLAQCRGYSMTELSAGVLLGDIEIAQKLESYFDSNLQRLSELDSFSLELEEHNEISLVYDLSSNLRALNVAGLTVPTIHTADQLNATLDLLNSASSEMREFHSQKLENIEAEANFFAVAKTFLLAYANYASFYDTFIAAAESKIGANDVALCKYNEMRFELLSRLTSLAVVYALEHNNLVFDTDTADLHTEKSKQLVASMLSILSERGIFLNVDLNDLCTLPPVEIGIKARQISLELIEPIMKAEDLQRTLHKTLVVNNVLLNLVCGKLGITEDEIDKAVEQALNQ